MQMARPGPFEFLEPLSPKNPRMMATAPAFFEGSAADDSVHVVQEFLNSDGLRFYSKHFNHSFEDFMKYIRSYL